MPITTDLISYFFLIGGKEEWLAIFTANYPLTSKNRLN
jgi:hypothetical protein